MQNGANVARRTSDGARNRHNVKKPDTITSAVMIVLISGALYGRMKNLSNSSHIGGRSGARKESIFAMYSSCSATDSRYTAHPPLRCAAIP